MKKSITAVLAALFMISPAKAWPGNTERIKGGDLSVANA